MGVTVASQRLPCPKDTLSRIVGVDFYRVCELLLPHFFKFVVRYSNNNTVISIFRRVLINFKPKFFESLMSSPMGLLHLPRNRSPSVPKLRQIPLYYGGLDNSP